MHTDVKEYSMFPQLWHLKCSTLIRSYVRYPLRAAQQHNGGERMHSAGPDTQHVMADPC